MNITLKDGRTLIGTPLQIVKQMRSLAFTDPEQTLGQYIDWVAENALRFDDIALNVTGETDEQRADSLVQEMLRAGLARSTAK